MSKFLLRSLGTSHESGYQQPHLHACLEAVLEQSDLLADEVLAGLKTVSSQAGGKGMGSVEPAVVRAINGLQMKAVEFRQTFAALLRKGVFGGAGADPAGPSMRFDDFQLLNAVQLEANIELAHSQQALAVAVAGVLPKLNAIVSNLLGWSTVQGHLNPLRPDNFSHALRGAIGPLVPDQRVRGIVVGMASGILGTQLSQLYTEVVDWLRIQGVEAVHMTSTKATGMWNPTQTPDSTVARTMLTLNMLRRLLSGELDPKPSPSDRVDFAVTIPASMEALQDMKLVEPMLKRLAERAGKARAAATEKAGGTAPGAAAAAARGAAPAGKADMLDEKSRQEQRAKLGQELGKEVVALMLENLMRDRRLLPRVRASVQGLEPVLNKLSQHDARFFSERHHPARVFLDRMTHRSLAFANEAAPGYSGFQAALDRAAQELSAGTGDASAFARILVKMDEASSEQEAVEQKRAAGAARGLMRAEQRNMLARLHSKMLAERLVGIHVPHAVSAFLRGPWAQVIAEAQIHRTDGSEDPGGYLALVDDLIWSVQKQLIRNNQERLLELVPQMLIKLREGLALISFPLQRMAAFFDTLVTYQEKALDDPDSAPSTQSVAAPQSEMDSFWVAPAEAQDAGYLTAEELERTEAPEGLKEDRRIWQVERLSAGAWVDLMVDGDWRRAQLHWFSPQKTLFMFLSAEGLAHSMTLRTVEKLKTAGRIRLVADTRVMDKALDGVAQIALDNDLRSRNRVSDERRPEQE